MTTIFGVSEMAYSIRLEYDGLMYHYTVCKGWRVISHFTAEFDTEHEAKEWGSALLAEHVELIRKNEM